MKLLHLVIALVVLFLILNLLSSTKSNFTGDYPDPPIGPGLYTGRERLDYLTTVVPTLADRVSLSGDWATTFFLPPAVEWTSNEAAELNVSGLYQIDLNYAANTIQGTSWSGNNTSNSETLCAVAKTLFTPPTNPTQLADWKSFMAGTYVQYVSEPPTAATTAYFKSIMNPADGKCYYNTVW